MIGNASDQQAKERRRNVVKDMNKDVMLLAEEDDKLQGAATLLFGKGFEKKMKEHVDAVHCLRKSGKPTHIFGEAAPMAQDTTKEPAATGEEADTDFTPTTTA